MYRTLTEILKDPTVQPMPGRLLDRIEAAKYLKLHPDNFKKMKVPEAGKVGREPRYKMNSLDWWAKNNAAKIKHKTRKGAKP